MTKLSVNINKIATIRNARGGNIPNVLEAALHCEQYGAEGITVHPRPDERHIRYQDVRDLKKQIVTEFNIEGYPSQTFMDLVLSVQPAQVTLVPDDPTQLTSDHGWNTIKHKTMLTDLVATFKEKNIRTSIFVDPDEEIIYHAAETHVDRIELYTESYAKNFPKNPEKAIEPYIKAAKAAKAVNLGINAGHDLDLHNLRYFVKHIEGLLEVSIGHALISDALYFGLENTIQKYLHEIKQA
ncbi:MAG: pyridoxine 5'-phosphate synthase [Bacteroidetes bacterium]|nr:MAG: pyridoxine 5'-phosphate synthase [Bacteroidota bacterium]